MKSETVTGTIIRKRSERLIAAVGAVVRLKPGVVGQFKIQQPHSLIETCGLAD